MKKINSLDDIKGLNKCVCGKPILDYEAGKPRTCGQFNCIVSVTSYYIFEVSQKVTFRKNLTISWRDLIDY